MRKWTFGGKSRSASAHDWSPAGAQLQPIAVGAFRSNLLPRAIPAYPARHKHHRHAAFGMAILVVAHHSPSFRCDLSPAVSLPTVGRKENSRTLQFRAIFRSTQGTRKCVLLKRRFRPGTYASSDPLSPRVWCAAAVQTLLAGRIWIIGLLSPEDHRTHERVRLRLLSTSPTHPYSLPCV